MKDRNEIIVSGTVVGIKYVKDGASVRIVTDGGGVKALPTFYFYDAEDVHDFRIRDRVTVKGYMRIRTERNKETRKVTRFIVDFIGESMEKTKRILGDYIDEAEAFNGGYPDDTNKAIFAGKVRTVVKPSENVRLLCMECEKDGRRHLVEMSAFYRQADIISNLKPGDRVIAAGSVRTAPDKKNPKRLVQNIVCKDVCPE